MPTLFTRITRGEVPGHFVHRDDLCVAFMSINPISRGHTLVVPIEEVNEWTDLAPSTSSHLFEVAGNIGRAQKAVYGCLRVGLIVAGYEIPHCHIHVIPTNSMADLSFENASAHVDSSELSSEAKKLEAALRTV